MHHSEEKLVNPGVFGRVEPLVAHGLLIALNQSKLVDNGAIGVVDQHCGLGLAAV